jgi:hypothetical protein
MSETTRQMVVRRVIKAREIVFAQRAVVEHLRLAGNDPTRSEALPSQLERNLAILEGDLKRITSDG